MELKTDMELLLHLVHKHTKKNSTELQWKNIKLIFLSRKYEHPSFFSEETMPLEIFFYIVKNYLSIDYFAREKCSFIMESTSNLFQGIEISEWYTNEKKVYDLPRKTGKTFNVANLAVSISMVLDANFDDKEIDIVCFTNNERNCSDIQNRIMNLLQISPIWRGHACMPYNHLCLQTMSSKTVNYYCVENLTTLLNLNPKNIQAILIDEFNFINGLYDRDNIDELSKFTEIINRFPIPIIALESSFQ